MDPLAGMDASLQTNSLSWQLRQTGKNISEWIQLQLARGNSGDPAPLPTFEFPPWLGNFVFGCLLIGGVIWLTWVIVQVIEAYLVRRSARSPAPQKALIVPPETYSVAAWLKQAQQFERAGNWREACRALYLAALQLLHDRDWLPHQLSRTDGEYLQAIPPLAKPRPLQVLIRTHERSLFGGEPLAADNCQRCRQAFEELNQP
ncbi:MAG: DUF4129 domain-containing protein [Leptolyngbyaceae cyanobacterium]